MRLCSRTLVRVLIVGFVVAQPHEPALALRWSVIVCVFLLVVSLVCVGAFAFVVVLVYTWTCIFTPTCTCTCYFFNLYISTQILCGTRTSLVLSWLHQCVLIIFVVVPWFVDFLVVVFVSAFDVVMVFVRPCLLALEFELEFEFDAVCVLACVCIRAFIWTCLGRLRTRPPSHLNSSSHLYVCCTSLVHFHFSWHSSLVLVLVRFLMLALVIVLKFYLLSLAFVLAVVPICTCTCTRARSQTFLPLT